MSNLSQEKRQRMLGFLEEIKRKNQDEETRIAINEIENELTEKKYGLIWEKHEENVDIQMRTNVPVFTEVKTREIIRISDSTDFNFLLEGDNLHSLKLLEKTHKEKVDVIYIDPPYNRGKNDFVYDDNFIKEEDAFKHSMWLSFMEERLRIAYHLLRNDGLIFLSIDDKEQSQLKLLMDEIFSEDNFILTMPRITKKSGKTTTAYAKNHDYILIYTKREQNIFIMEEHTDPEFKYEDEYKLERGKYKLNQTLDYDSLSYSASLDYPIEIEGEVFYPGSDVEKWKKRQEGNHRRADWAWRWSRKLFDFGYKNGFVVIKRKGDGTARIYTKTYLNAKIDKDDSGEPYILYTKRTKATSSIDFVNNIFSNDNAKKDLAAFGLKDDFDYSKPVELIKKLIRSYYKKNALVLDFFAGSGTTAQAVLELNLEDDGKRKFIICTNNQNNICKEVTYKRIAGVIEYYNFNKDISEKIFESKLTVKDIKDSSKIMQVIEEIKKDRAEFYDKFKITVEDSYICVYGIKKIDERHGIPSNLKYYKTDFIPKTSVDEFYSVGEELTKHIKEMVQLEHGISLDSDEYILLLTDDDADKLEKNAEKLSMCKEIYISSSVFLTGEQKRLFSGVAITKIPDYYFEEELKEVGEL